jgi:hypothetical protein
MYKQVTAQERQEIVRRCLAKDASGDWAEGYRQIAHAFSVSETQSLVKRLNNLRSNGEAKAPDSALHAAALSSSMDGDPRGPATPGPNRAIIAPSVCDAPSARALLFGCRHTQQICRRHRLQSKAVHGRQ